MVISSNNDSRLVVDNRPVVDNRLVVNDQTLPPKLAMRMPPGGFVLPAPGAPGAPKVKAPALQGREVTTPIKDLATLSTYRKEGNGQGVMSRVGEAASQTGAWLGTGTSAVAATIRVKLASDSEAKRAATLAKIILWEQNHVDSSGLNAVVLGKEKVDGLNIREMEFNGQTSAEKRKAQTEEAKRQIAEQVKLAAQASQTIKTLPPKPSGEPLTPSELKAFQKAVKETPVESKTT